VQHDDRGAVNACRMRALLDRPMPSRYGNASRWNSTTKKQAAHADSIK
jgi:hypothetical protein